MKKIQWPLSSGHLTNWLLENEERHTRHHNLWIHDKHVHNERRIRTSRGSQVDGEVFR